MATYDDPAEGITDADWLQQIAELLGELDPQTRSARCPECGGSQLIYCEEVNLHYKLIDADATSWRFSGDSDGYRDEFGELPLLARYFARRVTTIATNANAAKTTAAMPIFFICSHLS